MIAGGNYSVVLVCGPEHQDKWILGSGGWRQREQRNNFCMSFPTRARRFWPDGVDATDCCRWLSVGRDELLSCHRGSSSNLFLRDKSCHCFQACCSPTDSSELLWCPEPGTHADSICRLGLYLPGGTCCLGRLVWWLFRYQVPLRYQRLKPAAYIIWN